MKDVLIFLLTFDDAMISWIESGFPKTMLRSTLTTLPFCRTLWTVAYLNSGSIKGFGFLGRPRFPVLDCFSKRLKFSTKTVS